ncbi:MAG: glutathione S-transferase family protein [Burkholderiaceae bacterium]
MTQPRLFGTSNSRALRALWGMEEVGIPFEHVPTGYGPESKAPEYLAVNPNGRIPALIDGDMRLFESMAINLYLTKRYGGALYPAKAKDEATAWQWSVWAISEIEPLQMQVVIQRVFTPQEKRDARVEERALRGLKRPLNVLDGALADRDYLLGEEFTVADLNVAGVMHLMQVVGIELGEYPSVSRWRTACSARPALTRALARP